MDSKRAIGGSLGILDGRSDEVTAVHCGKVPCCRALSLLKIKGNGMPNNVLHHLHSTFIFNTSIEAEGTNQL